MTLWIETLSPLPTNKQSGATTVPTPSIADTIFRVRTGHA